MSARPHAVRKRAFRPALEGMEGRELLSAFPALPQLSPIVMRSATTVPGNGDVNPYGVAFVPRGFPRGGPLNPGDILVANFNNSGNLQGTGTTVVRVTPTDQTSVFYQGPTTPGLSTALGVLKRGFVIVGRVPSTDGTSATAGQGSLLIIDRFGRQVANLSDPSLLNGPWDLTVHDQGNRAQVFVSNVLSGTVSRIDLRISARGQVSVGSTTQIASGYTHRGDPNAFELGPTGLAFDARTDTLYVASTADNAIFAVRNAGRTRSDGGRGTVVYQDNAHLHGPLGLAFAPNGDLIAANGDAINPDPNQTSTLVEFTRRGRFVAQYSISLNPGGAFGVAVSPAPGAQLAAVNDNTNTLEVWKVHR